MNDIEKVKIQFLCFSYAFELYWAYYSQSSGHLFEKETRNSLGDLLKIYMKLISHDKKYRDPKFLAIGEHSDVDQWLEKMKSWVGSSRKWIFDNQFMSRMLSGVLFIQIRGVILKELGVKNQPGATFSSEEFLHSEECITWLGHIPFVRKLDDINKSISKANKTPSIIVTGDIRRSQHLLTYSKTDEDYSVRMIEFLAKSRELLEKSYGIFDKFTGDGFLAYFNEEICDQCGKDFVSAFLDFNRQIQEFSAEHFGNWEKSLRVIPKDTIGLAIGADIDQVLFNLIDYHFIAVSEGIVWSTRMASGALADQTIINNRLYERLKNNTSIEFEDSFVKPKYGEPVRAKLLKNKNAKKGSK